MSSAETLSVRAKLAEIVTDSSGDTRERLPLSARLKYSLAIRRVEFLPGHLLIGLVPAVLGAYSWGDLLSLNMLLAVLWAITNMQLADMINALADREEDALYKSRVSAAVYGLGVPRVVTQIALTSAFYFGVAIFLAIRTQHWDLLLIVAAGWFVGAQYSLPPLHFKSAGVGQLLGLHMWVVIPGLFVLRSHEGDLAWNNVVAVVGLTVLLVASFVTNQAEDYFDDEKFGIRTYVRALGISKALIVQSTLLFTGALMVVGSVALTTGLNWGMLPYLGAWIALQSFLFTIIRDVRAPIDVAITKVRRKALMGPYLGVLMSATTVVMGIVVLIGR